MNTDAEYLQEQGLEPALRLVVSRAMREQPDNPLNMGQWLKETARLRGGGFSSSKPLSDHDVTVELEAEISGSVDARMAEWGAGDGSEATDDKRKEQKMLVEAEEIAKRTDLKEFASLGAGCEIGRPELRGITLVQLRAVEASIKRRCAAEGWQGGRPIGPPDADGKPTLQTVALVVEIVNLYDADKYVIRPLTVARKCSFVEMVARAEQSPKWFVSDWHGAPVAEIVACLKQHAQDYGKNEEGKAFEGGTTEETPYWVSAFANN